MILNDFPTSVNSLRLATTGAINAQQVQGLDQQQHHFLNRLQLARDTARNIQSMISAVDTTLNPPATWKKTLNLSQLQSIATDFGNLVSTQNFDVLKYANISQPLSQIDSHVRKICDTVWAVVRDAELSNIDLEFECPNDNVLKAIKPTVKLPISFTLLQKRLRGQSKETFGEVWDECEGDGTKFSTHLQTLKNSVLDYHNAVDPILDAMASTPTEVAQFLNDAARGSATLVQVMSPAVNDWLNRDPKLLESFVMRFKDGI
jgi:hypothetical protein